MNLPPAASPARRVRALRGRLASGGGRRGAVALGGLALAALYAARYAADPARPGAGPDGQAGWSAWFDQSQTLRSTAALAEGNLAAPEHYYPLGYALLGLPGWLLRPDHPFFLPDLLSLLLGYGAFVALSRRLGLPAPVAVLLFGLAAAGDAALFRQWVVPWSTTPAAAALLLLLATAAAWLDGVRRPVAAGVLAALVAVCRPSDAVLLLPALAAIAWTELRARRLRDLWRLGLAGALPLAAVAALHLAIHGAEASAYMRTSAVIGFTPHDLGWKAYVLLVDPFAWFADGEGLLQRAPWMALALPGALAALARGPKDRVVAATLVLHALLYLSYVDLLPVGLWRFLNVHYWAWAVPGYALLAALLLRDLALGARRARAVALAALVAAAPALCLRYDPEPAPPGAPAKAVDLAGPLPPFTATYFGGLALQDGRGTLWNNRDMRVVLYPGGVRVVGLRRAIEGPVAWLPGYAPAGIGPGAAETRWRAAPRLAWPPAWTAPAPPPPIPIPQE